VKAPKRSIDLIIKAGLIKAQVAEKVSDTELKGKARPTCLAGNGAAVISSQAHLSKAPVRGSCPRLLPKVTSSGQQ
jgi:hypothetical protein